MKPNILSSPIGVFDSGIGGLTVVSSISKLLPNEDIIYFGDTARVPYGNKSPDAIKRFSCEITDFLISRGIKAIVVACNTASSLALPFLKNKYDIPLLGVISPAVKEAIRLTKKGRIGVIGTVSTISSGAYDREIRKHDLSVKLYSKSCPLFVPLVENSHFDDDFTYTIASRYLDEIKKKTVDVLILGCTHYPMIKHTISDVMGGAILIDSAGETAKELKSLLVKNSLIRNVKKKTGEIRCFVSDDPSGFKKTASKFLRKKITVERVSL